MILAESNRYNLGPVVLTVNIPTLALLFLDPANQSRFTFERKGRRRVQGVETAEVQLVERERPALVRAGANRDAPAKGRVWIEPESGAVLHRRAGDLDIDPKDPRQQKRARIVTEYRRDAKHRISSPLQMQEATSLPWT